MKKKAKKLKIKILILLLLCISQTLLSQEKYTLSGTVSEAATGETLISVNVLIPELNAGTITNEYGFYSITLPEGTYKLIYSSIGFAPIEQTIELTKNISQNIELKEDSQQLEEVIITANIEQTSIKKPQMSVNTLSSSTIKKIPVVLGEADVVQSLLLLPGVSNAGEGSNGFNVRGGAVDQNLILLDEAIIFNSAHLFGFFSVFNPDAIKDVKLYKGGIPAKYGGRVSSVLDIFQKEGNSKEFKMTGGIGAVASRLLAEGPIQKDKSAFLIGGRASYAHLFLPLFDIDNQAYFYDLNTKLNFKLNERNNIFISGYFGRDLFSIGDNFSNVYGNSLVNFRWNHIFSDKLFSNLSLIYSDYYYGLELDFVGFQWDSGIQNFNLKYDLKHYLSDKLQVNYGLNNVYYSFNPGEIRPNRADSGIVAEQLTKKYANEFAAYVDIEHEITPQLRMQYGLRLSNFIRFGQDELNVYENNNAVVFDESRLIYKAAEPIETISSSRSEQLANFTNFEPRISASYIVNEDTSIKGSYTRLAQYLHLLSNTNSPTPLDVWTPSGPFVQPQLLDQYALGFFKNIKNREFTLEAEIFYKDIQNRIDYIDGADLIANNAIETVILNGQARSYGLEILFRKNLGKFQGWLAYTLSKSEQRTPGRTSIETGINNSNWYNTPFDRPHDISVYGSYELNEKWSFNTNFVYQTGRPTNFPIGQFSFQDVIVPYFGQRNQERLPDYHRIDISATLIPRKNKDRKWYGEWVFSIYNLYNRRNAAAINFGQNEDTGVNEAVRTSIFGIVPSVTYNFKF